MISPGQKRPGTSGARYARRSPVARRRGAFEEPSQGLALDAPLRPAERLAHVRVGGIAHDLHVGVDVRVSLEVDHGARTLEAPHLPIGIAAPDALGAVEIGVARHALVEAVALVDREAQGAGAAVVLDRRHRAGAGVVGVAAEDGGEEALRRLAPRIVQLVHGDTGERRVRAARLEHELVGRRGQDRARSRRGIERREEGVRRIAVVGEGVALDAPAVVPDLVPVRDAAAEGRALRRAAAAQHEMAAHEDGMGAGLRGLAVDREHGAVEASFDRDRAREVGAAPRREQGAVERVHEDALLGGEERPEVRALEHRERVHDLAGGMVRGQHDESALALGEGRSEGPQGLVRGERRGRVEDARDAEPPGGEEARSGPEAEEQRAPREDGPACAGGGGRRTRLVHGDPPAPAAYHRGRARDIDGGMSEPRPHAGRRRSPAHGGDPAR